MSNRPIHKQLKHFLFLLGVGLIEAGHVVNIRDPTGRAFFLNSL
jgi:hypothetical protein